MRLLLLFLLLAPLSGVAQAQAPTPAPAPTPAEPDRPHLVVDMNTGRVLTANRAFDPWHPASLTKMMTAYTALKMIERGEAAADTDVQMTWWASRQSPSKLGYRAGTLMPLRDALAAIAVKSANDVSQAIAESLGPTAEDFAARMNAEARRIGMTGSTFVNPHGLHHPRQVTTARDMALLVRAFRRDFPDWMWLWKTPAVRATAQGKARTYRSFNQLLGRFPGADGMKTGFVCPSGWNFAGSATRDGRTVLAVVLGRNNGTDRVVDSARFLERAFEGRFEPGPPLDELAPAAPPPVAPPNLRAAVCDTKHAPKREPLQALPAGVQGPPGPPRVWLSPSPKSVPILELRTSGWRPHAPDLARLDVPLPAARPPDPPLDGLVLAPPRQATVPTPRPEL